MKRIEFGCICDLAEIMNNYIVDNVSDNEYPIISAYVNYDKAKALVETLIRLGNSIGGILELEDYEMSHYDKEYVIYLTENGVTCEKTYHENEYYNGGGDISFVYEDCNSKLLSHIYSKVMYEFAVGECDEDVDEDCGCDECEFDCKDKDGELATLSTYFVNGKPVDKSVFEKYDKELRARMKQIEDEMNAFRRLFW